MTWPCLLLARLAYHLSKSCAWRWEVVPHVYSCLADHLVRIANAINPPSVHRRAKADPMAVTYI
jgi:hypothetical protein